MLMPKLNESRACALEIDAAPIASAKIVVCNIFILISKEKTNCIA
jgi:hypothetical protein